MLRALLEPAQCRGARQRLVAITRRLHHRVIAKRVVVVQILVSQRHRVHALTHHRHHLVTNLPALAPITEGTGNPCGQTQPPIHLP